MKHRTAIALSAVSMLGCSPGQGDARLFIDGGEEIEQQIPATDVEDGWTITFNRFLVVVGEVELLSKELEIGTIPDAPRVYDFTQPGPHLMGLAGALTGGDWAVGFGTPQAVDDTEGQEFVAEFDIQLMRDNGYSVFIEGSATDAGTTKTFAWGFTDPIRYTNCGGQTAIEITNDGLTPLQLNIVGDRFFRDDLSTSGASLRFQPFVLADVDDNGQVTEDELAQVSLASLPGSYGAGEGVQVSTLLDYVRVAARNLAELDGAGRCESSVRTR